MTSTKTQEEEVLYYENFDLETVPTPVDVDKFESLLLEADYPKEEIKFLCDGFRNGFSLGYEGPQDIKQKSQNLKFHQGGDKVQLWNKVMKEVKAK